MNLRLRRDLIGLEWIVRVKHLRPLGHRALDFVMILLKIKCLYGTLDLSYHDPTTHNFLDTFSLPSSIRINRTMKLGMHHVLLSLFLSLFLFFLFSIIVSHVTDSVFLICPKSQYFIYCGCESFIWACHQINASSYYFVQTENILFFASTTK